MTNKQFFAMTFLVLFSTWDPPPDDLSPWAQTLSVIAWLVMFVFWAIYYFAAVRESSPRGKP